MTWLWVKDAFAGALLAVILALCASLPLIAPFGISDLFNHRGLQVHHQGNLAP